MKVNETPEKIYLLSTPYRILDGWYDNELPIPKDMNQLEYTRTDAFIEKALRWMISQGGINDALSKEMIDDFRKYMK